MTPRPIVPWIRRAVVALGATFLVAGGGLREDELDCEEAVAHLASCCPNYDPTQIACKYSSTCGITLPALSVEESRCILDLSCDHVVQAGLCESTEGLSSPHTDEDGGVSDTHPAVCL